jgi:uncharacterized protein
MSDEMSLAAQKQNDATMNDIMASLKRIMSDEERAKAAPQPAPVSFPPLKRQAIDLTDHVHAFEDVDTTRALDPRAGYNELDFLPTTTPSTPVMRRKAEPMNDTLLSATTHAAVTQAFSQLNQAVAPAPAKTLDAIAAEMLQPLIKKWLDDNLPNMVERLIRAEIERVARGGK